MLKEAFIASSCRICGWGAPTEAGLCLDCQNLREWSRINRAFCDLVHRASYDPTTETAPPEGTLRN